MSIITPQAEAFLEEYINNPSPIGLESSGQKIWIDYIKDYVDEWRSDNYGTAYGIINPEAKYKVVIEAHADEISWMVNYIADNGFIQVIRHGGSDHMIATSKRVNIHTRKNGTVKGIFGWPAIHVRRGKDADMKPTIENIFIDVGAANKQEVLDMGIHVGCVVTYEDKFMTLNNRFYVGRALDNRMGGFCIAQVGAPQTKNESLRQGNPVKTQ